MRTLDNATVNFPIFRGSRMADTMEVARRFAGPDGIVFSLADHVENLIENPSADEVRCSISSTLVLVGRDSGGSRLMLVLPGPVPGLRMQLLSRLMGTMIEQSMFDAVLSGAFGAPTIFELDRLGTKWRSLTRGNQYSARVSFGEIGDNPVVAALLGGEEVASRLGRFIEWDKSWWQNGLQIDIEPPATVQGEVSAPYAANLVFRSDRNKNVRISTFCENKPAITASRSRKPVRGPVLAMIKPEDVLRYGLKYRTEGHPIQCRPNSMLMMIDVDGVPAVANISGWPLALVRSLGANPIARSGTIALGRSVQEVDVFRQERTPTGLSVSCVVRAVVDTSIAFPCPDTIDIDRMLKLSILEARRQIVGRDAV